MAAALENECLHFWQRCSVLTTRTYYIHPDITGKSSNTAVSNEVLIAPRLCPYQAGRGPPSHVLIQRSFSVALCKVSCPSLVLENIPVFKETPLYLWCFVGLVFFFGLPESALQEARESGESLLCDQHVKDRKAKPNGVKRHKSSKIEDIENEYEDSV